MPDNTKLRATNLSLPYKRCSSGRYRPVTPCAARPVMAPLEASAALGRQAAQGDRDPQGEAVPPDGRRVVGELLDPAQPVADGVRVHEKQPRGGLQRRALFQVGGQG